MLRQRMFIIHDGNVSVYQYCRSVLMMTRSTQRGMLLSADHFIDSVFIAQVDILQNAHLIIALQPGQCHRETDMLDKYVSLERQVTKWAWTEFKPSKQEEKLKKKGLIRVDIDWRKVNFTPENDPEPQNLRKGTPKVGGYRVFGNTSYDTICPTVQET